MSQEATRLIAAAREAATRAHLSGIVEVLHGME